jgi:adenylate cyclase
VDGELPLQALQSLSSAVALAEPETLRILLENARFFAWFPSPASVEEVLVTRLPGLDTNRLRERLARNRSLRWEAEIRDRGRASTVAIEARAVELAGRRLLVVEAFDISKQKEAEYMLDSYSKLVEKNTRDLEKEKERVEKLLLNIMPRSVYEELKNYGSTTPHRFESASVLMLDFVDFTEMAIARDPSATVGELNDIFSAFDRIVELFGCERIKTIGDAYMAVSGVPEPVPDHASNIARVALRMRRYIERRNASHSQHWSCRIGIDTGPLIGSIVGVQKYLYDIFGPAVNRAARLEQQAEPMQILLAGHTRALLADDFLLAEQGTVDLKGFGAVPIWSLEGEAPRRG